MKNKIVIVLLWTKQILCDSFLLQILLGVGKKCRALKIKHIICIIFVLTVLIQILFLHDLKYYRKSTTPTPLLNVSKKHAIDKLNKTYNEKELRIPSEAEFRINWIKNKLAKISKRSEHWDIKKLLNTVTTPLLSLRAHIFYDTSFRNIETDGKWNSWQQLYLDIANNVFSEEVYFKGIYKPPEDISSNFYPLLGCYSSRDSQIISLHFKQIRDTGIGVVVVPWWPSNTEENLHHLQLLLDSAVKFELKIALHIEAYAGRNAENFLENIKDLSLRYTSHQGFYKIQKNGKDLPVFYIFEPQLMPPEVWRRLLDREGPFSVRGTSYDGVFLGLLLQQHHRYHIQRSRFDGFYTYFPINGFSYGSTWKNWKSLGEFAAKNKLLFFPTVGPGFADSKARPGNGAQTRHRSRGHYYQVAWRTALSVAPYGISISSFNGWADGSQLEPVAPRHSYLDYEPDGPTFYLDLTRYWVKQFTNASKTQTADAN